MKSFNNYIKEEFELYGVKNLEVVFDCNPEQKFLEFQVPETYNEDSFQIYIQDIFLSQLPGDPKLAEHFFGKNRKNIFDVYFVYDKYEKDDESTSDDTFEFMTSYDSKSNDEKYAYIRVEKMQYVIKFDVFEYKCEDVNDTKDILVDIFKTCETNTTNKFPLKLVLNEDEMKYI